MTPGRSATGGGGKYTDIEACHFPAATEVRPTMKKQRTHTGRRVALVAVCGLVILAVQPGSAATSWNRYENGRFGYGVSFPSDWSASPPSDNGDGRVFTSPKGDRAVVWGGFEDTAPKGLKGVKVTYEKRTSDGWVQSGSTKKQIVYGRLRRRNGVYAVLQLTYPKSHQGEMNDIVTGMSQRFDAPCTNAAPSCQ